jgi:hypothetical protein
VHDAGTVRGIQCLRNLADHRNSGVRSHRAVHPQPRSEVGPFDQPHIQIESVVNLSVTVDGDDMGVV